MLFHQLLVLVGCSYSALAYVLNARDIASSFTTIIANVPPACNSTCTSLGNLASIDLNNTASAAPFCTASVEDTFNQCSICYESAAPQIFTPTILADLQTVVNEFVAACASLQSPISSITIPTPTATGDSGSASQSAAPTTQPSASTAPAPARTSSTSSRSGALGKTADMINIGGVGVLAVVGMIFFA